MKSEKMFVIAAGIVLSVLLIAAGCGGPAKETATTEKPTDAVTPKVGPEKAVEPKVEPEKTVEPKVEPEKAVFL